jgi:hypothetical protein
VVQRPVDPAVTALGDLFWVLAAGPEFQYIR